MTIGLLLDTTVVVFGGECHCQTNTAMFAAMPPINKAGRRILMAASVMEAFFVGLVEDWIFSTACGCLDDFAACRLSTVKHAEPYIQPFAKSSSLRYA